MSDEDLKAVIVNRFYIVNQRRNLDPAELMDNLPKQQIAAFTNDAVLYHMLSVRVMMKMKRENDAAILNPNLSEEELKHLKDRNTIFDKQLKRVFHLSKSARDQVKFDIFTQKVLPKEDANPVQLKETQTPGQVDWSDDSWLAGEKSKENVPD